MHFNFHHHNGEWSFDFNSFLHFLQGGFILWITEVNWIGFTEGAQSFLKTILLIVSIMLGVQSFLKKNKTAEKEDNVKSGVNLNDKE